MEWDDIVYLLLLILSVGLGDFTRRLESAHIKQLVSSSFGVLVVLVVSGWHALHCLIETTVNAIIICCLPAKYCHGVSFVFSFMYLLFFRCLPWLNLPFPSNGHTNAILMILSLKMVGLALEVRETALTNRQLKKTDDGSADVQREELELSLKFRGVKPTFADVFHYAFCHVGILTGPYFKYRTYWDMLHANDSKASHMQHVFKRLKLLPLYGFLFVISNHFFPLSYAKTEEIFTDRSLIYRLWYMTPLFFTFRMRFYSGFILSEVACMTAGLGAYPSSSEPKPGAGPTVLKHLSGNSDASDKNDYNFEAIHNIDEYAVEFTDVRSSLKSWNMTVQWWLVQNVFRRFPIKPLRTVFTMLVSAFWHGVHSGYYLSMLTVPFVLVAEDAAKRKFRSLQPRLFDMVAGFAKIQWFSYMGVAFSLLAFEPTLNYWRSVYFVGHVAIIVVYAASRLAPKMSNTS